MGGKNSDPGVSLVEFSGHVLADLAKTAGDNADLAGYIKQFIFHRVCPPFVCRKIPFSYRVM